MSDIRIEKLSSSEIPAVIAMIKEFANYSGLERYLEVTEESLREVMFGKNAFVQGLIALESKLPVGYALFYPGFLSFRGQRSVYLEDIYVKEKHRASGIGKMLLTEVAKTGVEFGAVRMDFQVLRSNSKATAFYKNIGAIVDEDERHFKIIDDAFAKISS